MASPTFQSLRDEIENQIVAAALRPGDRLDEGQLASRFGVSRTPVREALMQLAASGFVEIRPRRGAVVAELGPERVVEMFEVMAELEGMAGAHAARRWTEADRVALLDAHGRCEAAAAAGDADSYYYDNEAFHRAIYLAGHNAFLAETCVALHRRLRPYRRLQLRVRDRMQASLAEHRGIVEAILAGDPEASRGLLRSHVVVQGDRFSDLMASIRQVAAGTT